MILTTVLLAVCIVGLFGALMDKFGHLLPRRKRKPPNRRP